VDPGLLDRKINELRANLNDMIRKHSEAENYLRRLANERDVILEQTVQISMILEERQTAITHPQDQAELLFVPAGLIVPGRPRLSAEEQQRDMRFVRSFYLDKYPVTNAQFVRFVEATGYKTIAERLNLQEGCNDPTWCTPNGHGSTLEGRENHPVVWVYREDARRYAEWAGRRLPTRLEWERAMRGLEGYTWPWGNEWRDNVCNLNREGTTPVDAFPAGASPVGCLDMVGNVWEWLSDELAGGKLLLMGGSWAEERKRMGTGYKGLVFPRDGTDGATGFRCAMDVPGGSDGSDE
jgi:formylglycine-generating enzyme required for sulfatase activity